MSKENNEPETVVEIGEYKGNATLSIFTIDKDGDKKPFPFSFGKAKAKLIVKHMKEIEEFVK
jgi:hypothetical protein